MPHIKFGYNGYRVNTKENLNYVSDPSDYDVLKREFLQKYVKMLDA